MSDAVRQLPRWSQLRPLVRMRPVESSRTKRRLSSAFTIADLRAEARRRVPRSVFDYTDGAADDELGLRRARQLFRSLEFHPNVLRNVSQVNLETAVLTSSSAYPFVLAPTGFTRLMNHEGERAVARVAARHGIPYGLSTLGTTTIEDVAAAAPGARQWFQLYVSKDRGASEELMQRAKASGYEALVLTVDVPVAGRRIRDAHNGFSIPPALTLKTMLDMARFPSWWVNLLTTEPLTFASLSEWDGTVAELLDRTFDHSVDWTDLDWVRSWWSGPIVVKGLQNLDDVRRAADAGVDAVVLSSHGGRQLDRVPVPLLLVPEAAAAVGDRCEIYVDTGVMSGQDVVAALALGARAVLVGRAYLYGLMAGGELGVERAVEILAGEVRRTMALLGVTSVSDLTHAHVSLP